MRRADSASLPVRDAQVFPPGTDGNRQLPDRRDPPVAGHDVMMI
jgi:hypothetical protein